MAKSLKTMAINYMNMVASQRQNAEKLRTGEWTEDDVFAEAYRQACVQKGRAYEVDGEYRPAVPQRQLGAYFVPGGEPLLPGVAAGFDDEDALVSGEDAPDRTYDVFGRYVGDELSSIAIGLRYEPMAPISPVRSPEQQAIAAARAEGRDDEADALLDKLVGSTAWRDALR